MERHAGRVEIIYTPNGERLVQHGKDLTGVRTVIGTGGPIIFSGNGKQILGHCAFREGSPFSLKPGNPVYYIDEQYILFAVGLLGQVEPEKALRIAKKYLKKIEN